MKPTLHISLLADFLLLSDDTAVTIVSTPRLRSLLAYLLLHRDAPQPRLRLAFLLWPDTSDAQAQTNLRQLMHRLRTALPQLSPYILSEGRTLQWNSDLPFTLDVMEFERLLGEAARSEGSLEDLARAVQLYRGDLFPDLYDEWIIGERAQLRERYMDALETLANSLLRDGRYSEARFYADLLKDADPLREITYRTLMETCAAIGDYSGAVRVYQECAALLEEEIGVQPSPATQATYRRILEMAAEHQDAATTLPVATRSKKVPTNLPASPNSFVGRHAEFAAVSALIGQDTVRLLTLVGAPGVGKTRLALEVAASRSGSFPDGVYMVPLAPISDPSFVASTIAHTLGVREEANHLIADTLTSWLGDKRLLLLLDNFEHVLDAAIIVSSLLSSCSNLKVLVTSREALELYGEHEFPVPPLELPGPEETATMEPSRLGEYSAIKLFKDRASAVQFGFTLDVKNTAIVAAICRKLDALPLAIELAASRVKQLPPDILLQRLEQRLDELATRVRDLPARHQTLRAAIAWSYDLLQPQEQILFRGLGLFVGGCTIEAAQNVVMREGDVASVLNSLLDKSLLYSTTGANDEARYFMLETVREYSQEKLKESSEWETVQKRYAVYFMTLAEEADSYLLGARQREWLNHLGDERDNLRYALQWARQTAVRHDLGTVEIWLRMAAALWRYWNVRGYYSEGRGDLEEMLASTRMLGALAQGDAPDTMPKLLGRARAKALQGAAILAWKQGDFATTEARLQESLAAFKILGDKRGIALSLTYLGENFELQEDNSKARSHHEEALAIFRVIEEEWGIAKCLLDIGWLARNAGDLVAARSQLEESLAIWRRSDYKQGVSLSLNRLGLLATDCRDYVEARSFFEESLEIDRELGDKWAIALKLGNLGLVNTLEGKYASARSLYGEGLVLYRELGATHQIAWLLSKLGNMAMLERNYSAAHLQYKEGLEIAQSLMDRETVLVCLLGLLGATLEIGGVNKRSKLLRAYDTLGESIGNHFEADVRVVYKQTIASARARLGENGFEKELQDEHTLSMEEAIKCALAEGEVNGTHVVS